MGALYLCALFLLPLYTNGFLLSSPTALPTTNLDCYGGVYIRIDGAYTTNFNNIGTTNNSLIRLCAIQEYRNAYNNGSKFLRRVYTPIIITNTLRHIALTRCQGFSNGSDLGYGECTPQSYELYNSTSLCICATNLCNRDFTTCQQSVISSLTSPTIVPQVIPSLTTPVRCYENTMLTQYGAYYNTLNVSSVCIPASQYSANSGIVSTKLIDQQMCELYARANSVLCAVEVGSSPGLYSSVSIPNGYVNWLWPRTIRYTTDNYIEKIVAAFSTNNNYQYYDYYENYYSYISYDPNFVFSTYEGSTNVVIRRDGYDLVGNLLGDSRLYCFCSTDDCNIDFDTCASGINYNSTPPATIDNRPTTSSSGGSITTLSSRVTSSGTTVTGTATTRTTTTTNFPRVSSSVTAFFPFDGNALDMFATYNGTLVGGATFNRVGYVRQALLLSSNTQYVRTDFINIAYQSFTVSGWILSTNLANGTIFSECSARVTRKCLTLGILNRRLFMDFFGGFNVTGTTNLTASSWFHVAFVYDEVAQQQLIYLNGVENGRSAAGSTPPFIGTCLPANIGMPLIGSIDQLSVINRAKSTEEILADATLVAAYSFDGNLLDSSPNGFNASGPTSFISNGRLGQALQFTNTSTLFQTIGLTALTIPNRPFSISLWLKPQDTMGGSSVLLLSSTNWCMRLLGFNPSGALVFGVNGVSVAAYNLSNVGWTHLVYAYDPTNEVQLFINGTLVNSLQAVFIPGNSSLTLTIGGRPVSNPACSSVTIASGGYRGFVDELKVFSRALTLLEITDLASP